MEKEAIVKYRRFLKRRNYSGHTIKTYMNTLEHFLRWLSLPVEEVTLQEVSAYIDFLLAQGLAPKTINCRLDSVRGFFNYLSQEEGIPRSNPVKKGSALRLARPLPRYLKDEEVTKLFQTIKGLRDRAIFMLMLRCGLRVEEVAHLRLQDLDLTQRRILVCRGKGNKDRVVYISNDADRMLRDYLKSRSSSKVQEIFLVNAAQGLVLINPPFFQGFHQGGGRLRGHGLVGQAHLLGIDHVHQGLPLAKADAAGLRQDHVQAQFLDFLGQGRIDLVRPGGDAAGGHPHHDLDLVGIGQAQTLLFDLFKLL